MVWFENLLIFVKLENVVSVASIFLNVSNAVHFFVLDAVRLFDLSDTRNSRIPKAIVILLCSRRLSLCLSLSLVPWAPSSARRVASRRVASRIALRIAFAELRKVLETRVLRFRSENKKKPIVLRW